jgi:hypothetical protein
VSAPIAWIQPEDNGGCPITNYSILRSVGDLPFEAVHVAEMNDSANVRRFTVTELAGASAGSIVKFKIQATNNGGYTNISHKSLSVVIADVPQTPQTSP